MKSLLPSQPHHLPETLRHYVGVMSKRRRLKTPPPYSPANLSTTPLPPPTPTTQPKEESYPSTVSRSRIRRSLTPSLISGDWRPLDVPRSELSLPLTLPTGQTFRWRRTGHSQFTGVVGPHLLSLRHADEDPLGRVSFFLHDSSSSVSAAAPSALSDYLNIHISLADLWRGFAAADPRFADLSSRFDGGARVLRQDPAECVLQFLCSSNNNIARIEKMVGVLSSFGDYLGTVGGFHFHEFPTLERLSTVSEQQLREAGFGYRYIFLQGSLFDYRLESFCSDNDSYL
ncbi:N-glycosylase/DNA lyase OGG1 [Platanthera zijinensis]|uniref:N-glycosylase/DNA lyase OGG1 n=1 Tax=Platanthera zijinensis TaxID=2320716 RepID=A0AAP0BVH9_9ASPA